MNQIKLYNFSIKQCSRNATKYSASYDLLTDFCCHENATNRVGEGFQNKMQKFFNSFDFKLSF